MLQTKWRDSFIAIGRGVAADDCFQSKGRCIGPVTLFKQLSLGLLLMLPIAQSVLAQQPSVPPLPSFELENEHKVEADGTERSDEAGPFTLTAFTLAPQSRVRRGRYMIVRCRVVNEQEQRDAVTLVVTVTGRPGEQFARKVEIEPKRGRTVDIPIPVSEDFLDTAIEISCTLRLERDGREVLIEREGEAIEQKLRFPVDTSNCVTGTLLNRPPRQYQDWEWPKLDAYVTYDWVVATRVIAGHQRVTVDLESYPLPNDLVDWDSMDNIVIADERLFHNYAAVMAFKNWLMSGGRAWIMLDYIDPKLLNSILGPDQYLNLIDRTEITEAVLDSPTAFNQSDRNKKLSTLNSVKLVKIEQRGGEVTHTVDGWPAAIWMPIGEGEILFTTLGAEAWIRPSTLAPGKDDLTRSNFELEPWVGPLGDRFHQARVRMLPKTPALQYPVSKIGFRVLSRGVIAGVLSAFCLGLVAVGVYLHRRQRTEWIGWIGPTLALIVGCALALGAGLLRSDVPEGWHRIQVASTDGTGATLLTEQSAVYRAGPTTYPLEIETDAMLDPQVGVSVRDFRKTQENVDRQTIASEAWPTGIWRMEAQAATLGSVGYATASWSKEGYVLRLPEKLDNLEDMILAQPRAPRTIVVKGKEPNSYLVTAKTTLPPNEFADSAGLVDEKFFRRAEVLTQVLSPKGGESRPKSLQLMGWHDILPGGLAWKEKDVLNPGSGDALYRLPVVALAPAVNTEVTIPPALIRWDAVATDVGKAGAFMRTSGEWAGPFTNSMVTAVKAEIPEELKPIRSQRVSVSARVRAAGRDVVFFAKTAQGRKELGKFFSPQQVITLEIEDSEILNALNDDTLQFIIEVSGLKEKKDDGSGFVQAVPWQIEYLWMTVEGVANFQENP